MITLDEYKVYKRITSTTNDAKLNLLIPSCIKYVKEYCKYPFDEFVSVDKVEKFDANTNEIVPQVYPLLSVSSVLLNGALLVEDVDYFINYIDDTIHSMYGTFGYSGDTVQVTYRGGETHEDIKLAVMDLVTYYDQEQFTAMKQTMGATIQYSPAKLPNHIKRVLDMYRVL